MNLADSNHPYDAAELREVFAEAADLAGSERGRYLDSRCAGAPELRAAVERLLRADAQAASDTLWRRPAVYAEARHMAADGALPCDGLGPYKVLSRIGAGGMGTVYLAERDFDDVHRRVAVKVIPRLLLSDEAIRRFRQERQILARLEHPNIAGMLDAGTTAEGTPYLVMEFVDGVPLDRYCAMQHLPVRARLALFDKIAGAVAYAHRSLIVHRDLKPANILVTAEGVPKLLDFGIAKLLTETSNPEATAALVMTPGYASPEQLSGGAITTASDIYSLGVILYELLTGEKIAAPRQRLAGDMENVVSMALRPEPERRYASAGDLADDARRASEGYPVRARPDTRPYRLRRLVARRPLETSLVLGLMLALVTAAAIAYAQYRIANARFNQVRRIANSFLTDVYDAMGDTPGGTKARMIVARRAREYLDLLAREHSSELPVRRELASSYRRLGDILGKPFAPNLGDTAGALDSYEKAAAVLASIAASGHADAALYSEWGQIYSLEGGIAVRRDRPDEAVRLGEKAVALLERSAAMQPQSLDARFTLLNTRTSLSLAQLELGKAQNDTARLQAAESLAGQVAADARRIARQAPEDERWAALEARASEFFGYVETALAVLTGDKTYNQRAVRHQRDNLEISRALYARNPDRYRRKLADALSDVSRVLLEDGDLGEAEKDARESSQDFNALSAADPTNVEAARDAFVAVGAGTGLARRASQGRSGCAISTNAGGLRMGPPTESRGPSLPGGG